MVAMNEHAKVPNEPASKHHPFDQLASQTTPTKTNTVVCVQATSLADSSPLAFDLVNRLVVFQLTIPSC